LVLGLGLEAPNEGLGAAERVVRLGVEVPEDETEGAGFVGDLVGDYESIRHLNIIPQTGGRGLHLLVVPSGNFYTCIEG